MIEHYVSGIYLGTTDWPNYNYGLWRNMGDKIEGNKLSDGKWRFMTYDLDKTVGNNYLDIGDIEVYEYNMFVHMLRKVKNPPTSLFMALLQNEDFKNKFIKIFCDYINDVMAIYRIEPLLEYYRANVTDILQIHSKEGEDSTDNTSKDTLDTKINLILHLIKSKIIL